jgi:ribosomal protein L31
MSGLDHDALDRYITGGRFHEEALVVTCSRCGETTNVHATTDYGATDWDPGECGACHASFTGEEQTYEEEPPEPDYDRDPGPSDHFDARVDYPERFSGGPY